MALAITKSPMQDRCLQSPYVTAFRQEEKTAIKAAMSSGKILQVYGPPMVGKSVLIDQVTSEMSENQTDVMLYPIDCKSVKCFDKILEWTMETTELTFRRVPRHSVVLNKLKTLFKRNAQCHHVFVFYGCGAFRSLGIDHEFSNFITGISNFHSIEHLKVTVVFTSFVQFPDAARRFENIYVGMLTDPLEIQSLLCHYAPDVSNSSDYANACKHTWGLPDAIIRIAEEFLNLEDNNDNLPSPEFLEQLIVGDTEFVHIVFKKRLADVTSWLNETELRFAQVCRPTFSRTYAEDFLKDEYLAMSHTHNSRMWDIFFKKLKVKHVLLDMPDSDGMSFHPLVVYYVVTGNGQGGLTYMSTFTRQGRFLCRILIKAEESINLIGSSSQYYTHWSEFKHLLEKAIHHPKDGDPQGSFDALCKIGLTAGRLIMITFADEAKEFYNDLLKSASVYGSIRHRAVLQAYCGQLSALGSEINWQQAEANLKSAMEVLKQEGLTHFYRWTATRMAIVLQRQGKNLDAIKYHEVAKQSINQHQFRNVEDCLKVPDFLEQEEELTSAIYETIPLIFNGNTCEALEMLLHLYDGRKTELQYHPHYSVLLNNIGLALERDRNFRNALKWYKQSLEIRRPMRKITPHVLVTPLNNIAMILLHHFKEGSLNECEMYLKEAYSILEETNWHFGDRALTLNHLAEVNLRKKEYFNAFKFEMQALGILEDKMKNSEFILKVLLDLAHLRVVLGLQRTELDLSEPNFSEIYLEKSPEDYIQQITDIGRTRKGDSSDFHNNLLTTYGHGMLLKARRSREDFENFKSGFLEHQAKVKMDRQIKDVTRESIISKFDDLNAYITNTDFDKVDVNRLTEYVVNVCFFCRILRKDVANFNWKGAVTENTCSYRNAISVEVGRDIHETVLNESESGESFVSLPQACETGLVTIENPSISERSDDTSEAKSLILVVFNRSMTESDDNISADSSDDGLDASNVLNPSEKDNDY